MNLSEHAKKTRSIRRFIEDARISKEVIEGLVDVARFAPNGANLQTLRFSIVVEKEECSEIFPSTKWAGYIEDWDGPAEGERPAAYIVIQITEEEKPYTRIDAGIAAGYIVLAASELGIGSCMIMSFDPVTVDKAIGAHEGYKPVLLIALGIPAEKIVLEETDGDIKYWRDNKGIHHVPKLPLKKIIFE